MGKCTDTRKTQCSELWGPSKYSKLVSQWVQQSKLEIFSHFQVQIRPIRSATINTIKKEKAMEHATRQEKHAALPSKSVGKLSAH